MVIIMSDIIERRDSQGMDRYEMQFMAVIDHEHRHMTTNDVIVDTC